MLIFEKARELSVIHSAAAVIGWDQETYLPPAAAAHRAAQLSWLSSHAHEIATSDSWKAALEDAENSDPGNDPAASTARRPSVERLRRARSRFLHHLPHR